MIGLTWTELRAMMPCESRREAAKRLIARWGRRRVGAAEARAAGVPLDDMMWVISRMAPANADLARRVRLWAADCAAHVLENYERVGKSKAPREAIIAARRFARGEIDAQAAEAAAAAAAAEAEAAAAATRRRAAAWSAAAAAWSAAAATRRRAAAWSAAATASERAWQYDRLVAWLSDKEPEDWPLPDLTIARI